MRLEALARRGSIDPDKAVAHAQAATDRFMAEVAPDRPVAVAVYWPIRHEIDTRPLIEKLFAADHRVALPAMVAPDAPLVFREWDGEAELIDNGFGTEAPDQHAPEVTPDIVVMPLAGFDATGHRLGYGKGYYDRTVAALPRRPLLVGFAFSAQEVDEIPAQPHDVRMDMIVTEQGVRRFDQPPVTDDSPEETGGDDTA